MRRLRFAVRVGDRVLERELAWEEIRELKELVKQFCTWDPASREWIARPADVVKSAGAAARALSEAFGPEGEEVVRELVAADEELRRRAAERGEILLLPERYVEDYLAYQLLKKCCTPARVELAGSPIEYYRVDLEAAADFLASKGVKAGELESALVECLQEIDSSLAPEQEEVARRFAASMLGEEQAVLIEDGEGYALVTFPRRLAPEEYSRLLELCSVDYYVQRRGEAGLELVSLKLKFLESTSSRTFRIPYFAVPYVEQFARELGLDVEDRVDWPLREVDVPRADFELYGFQREALGAWKKAGMRGTVVIPTGGGKTFVAMAAIAELRVPTLICVTTVELAKQWKERLERYLGVSAGLLAGGRKQISELTVATYHSASKRLSKLYDRFGFVVYDEGHHLPADTFKEIAFRLKAKYSMVLSATPERADRNEALIYKAAGEPVFATSYLDLVKMGVLAPLVHERVYVELTPDESFQYARVEEGEELEDLRRTNELMNLALRARRKLEALEKLVELERGKILVFCQYVEQAKAAYEAVRKVEPKCALVTGSTAKGRRLRAFERFRGGEVRVLVTTTVLDEGVDVPDADVAIILSGSGQVRQMVQRVGRVLRWAPGKIAKVYEVIAKGTIEEALSRSRSIYKFFDYREVRAALEHALRLYNQPELRALIEEYESAPPERRRELLEKCREVYSGLGLGAPDRTLDSFA